MIRKLFAASVFAATLGLAYGCGGFSEDRAKEQCDAEKAGRGSSFGDKSYDSCVSCFEDCGDDCVPSNGSPVTYSCPGDSSSGSPE